MPHRAVLFDLDGTLLNTLEGISLAGNAVLAECGFATYPVDEYRLLVGAGVRKLFERALPPAAATSAQIELCAEKFRDVYRSILSGHLGADMGTLNASVFPEPQPKSASLTIA